MGGGGGEVGRGAGGVKSLLHITNFTLGSDATLNTEIHKNLVRIKAFSYLFFAYHAYCVCAEWRP